MSMKKPLQIMILLVLFAPFSEAINRCESVFVVDQSQQHFLTTEVKEIARDQGQHGGQVMYLKRQTYLQPQLFNKAKLTDNKWYNYELSPDKPGDWRWAFDYFPTSMKYFFGLKILMTDLTEINSTKDPNAQILVIPNATEIIQGHEKLQQMISKTHPYFRLFQYYSADTIIDGHEYIRMLGEHRALPIGTNNYLLQHDWNFHVLSGFVMPDQIINALQRRAQLLLKFYDYCQIKCQQFKNGEYVFKKIQESYFNYASRTIDLTGNIFHETIRRPRLSPDLSNEILETMEIIFLKQLSPVDYLEQLLHNININFISQKTNGYEDLYAFYQEFIHSLPAEFRHSDLDKSYFTDPKAMISLANQKMKQLDRVIQDINEQEKTKK